jgi:hypothetical protein
MITQTKSDGLINFIDGKIVEIKAEIEYREDHWPRRMSEYAAMKYEDGISDLEAKLARWEQMKADVENIETFEEQPEFPPRHLYLPVERRAARSIV